MQTVSQPLALRPREAAKMLSISDRTLWRLTKEGKIPCVKLGEGRTHAVLYPISELEKFLSQMVAPISTALPEPKTEAN